MRVSRAARFLMYLFGGFLSSFVVLAILPHDPWLRYQSLADSIHFKTGWIYERVHFSDAPVDVLLVGPSRMQAAVSGPLLQQGLSERLDRDVHVLNASLANDGPDIAASLVRMVLNEKQPEMIVLTVTEYEPRFGHPAFRYVATAGEVVCAVFLPNTNYFTNLFFLPWRGLELFWTTLMHDAGFGETEKPTSEQVPPNMDMTRPHYLPDGRFINRSKVASRDALEAEFRKRERETTGAVAPEWLSWLEFRLQREYIRRIAAMAEEADVKVVFLYLPPFKGPEQPAAQEFLSQYGPILNAQPVLADPAAGLWADVNHVNRHGSQRVNDWLPAALAPLLRRDSHRKKMTPEQG